MKTERNCDREENTSKLTRKSFYFMKSNSQFVSVLPDSKIDKCL